MIRMKRLRKLTAVLTAVFMCIGMCMTVFADDTPIVPKDPKLSSGAYVSGYDVTLGSITKGSYFDITITTYIPIQNFSNSADAAALINDFNFARADKTSSFLVNSPDAYNEKVTVDGTFLKVVASFGNVMYTGTGNEFSFKLFFNSSGTGSGIPMTANIIECVEYKDPEQTDPTVPVYTLASGQYFTAAAGTETTITPSLRTITQGYITAASATLTSSDTANIQVLTTEAQNISSGAYITAFAPSFRINIPQTTPAGIYQLTLNVISYDIKGTAHSQDPITISLNVTNDLNKSGLKIDNYKVSKSPVLPDDKFNLTVYLSNDTGVNVTGAKVYLDGLDASKFVMDSGLSVKRVDIEKNGHTEVVFPLVAMGGISSVRESITIKVDYSVNPNNSSELTSTSAAASVECDPTGGISGGISKYGLSVTNYTVSRTGIGEGTKFTLTATVTNNSGRKINGARLTLDGLDGSKFAIDKGLSYASFDIEKGASKSFSFNLVGCKGIASIREVIPMICEYQTKANDPQSVESSTVNATVSCYPKQDTTQEEAQAFAPNIIITDYDFGGEYVTGGKTFPLSLTVQNASSSTAIQNLKVVIQGAAGTGDNGIAFSPANSSNSFFIEDLGPKSSTVINIDLIAKADSKPDSYPLEVIFDYEYTVGSKRAKAETVTEKITIPLQQEDRFSANPPELPTECYSGQETSISVTFVNKGKSSVYNVTVDVEGEGFDKTSTAYYIGNVDSGKEEYYDTRIIPNISEGEVKGNIVVTYEDANGTPKELTQEFIIPVMSMNYDNDPGMDDFNYDNTMTDMDGSSSGIPVWVWIAAGAAVIVVVVVIIVVVKKKRKKKYEDDDDEDI